MDKGTNLSVAEARGPTEAEAQANARLIAAAPDLYAKHEEWLFLIDSGQIEGPGIHAFATEVRKLLAKARGEQ